MQLDHSLLDVSLPHIIQSPKRCVCDDRRTRDLLKPRTEFISKQVKKDSSKENRHEVCYKVVLDGEAFIRYYFEMLKL